MKIIVGMATFKGREDSCKKAIDSLLHQCDEIVLYDNERNPNLTDNGKFYGLKDLKEPVYYFTCDDDLFYPSNYIAQMITAIETHKCIVTHHGRKLVGLNVSYYRGHKSYRCLDDSRATDKIDVPGTGVTGFSTEYFHPKNLHESEYQKMSDLVLGLEAAKQQKKIMILPHLKGWIKQLPIDAKTAIFNTMVKSQDRNIQIANEIYTLNNGR